MAWKSLLPTGEMAKYIGPNGHMLHLINAIIKMTDQE